jgi:16S rRNA (guanine527-N7)-methyltransferase
MDWEALLPGLTAAQHRSLDSLPAMYKEWNAKVNVVSRQDEDHLMVHHVLHSLAIARVLRFEPGAKVLDVGTGGGFPALPLAIVFPEVHWLAVDSIGKKIKVVQDIALQCGIHNLEARQARAETLDSKFDFVVSRAVARMLQLVEWTRHLMAARSRHALANGWLVLKGGDPQGSLAQELREVGFTWQLYPVRNFFDVSFFDSKFVVHMPYLHRPGHPSTS